MLLTPRSRPVSFVSRVMCSGVAFRAQCDQVLLCVGTRMAVEFPVVPSRFDIVPQD